MGNIKEPALGDWINTGIRIDAEMEKLGMNYSSLAKCISEGDYHFTATRQYISDICKGKSFPSLYLLRVLADVFQCDTAYLLCEQDCRKREATDIHAYTGLSETAIETLHALTTGKNTSVGQQMYTRHVIPFLNQLLSDQKTVDRFAGKLSAYAATADMKRNLKGIPDELTEMRQAGAIFELTRVFAEQAEIMFAPADKPDKKPVVIP